MAIRNEGQPSPSTQLNIAFTSLIEALDGKELSDKHRYVRSTKKYRGGLEEGRINRLNELINDHPKIYTQASEVLEFYADNRLLCVPVGEYGLSWAKRMITGLHSVATDALDQEKSVIFKEAEDVSNNFTDILFDYTFQSKRDATAKKVLRTTSEGFDSVLAAAAFLTFYKVPGYEDDPERLLKDLVDQRIFSRLALVIPPGITGLLSYRGGLFTSPTVIHDDGKLSIRSDIIRHFIEERSGEYKSSSTHAKERLERPGCPVARKINGNQYSGVDMAARIFANAVTQARP